MKDIVGKWYKSGFDRLKVIAPSSTWKSVSEHMKAWPSDWYEGNSDELDHQPAPATWQSISDSLQPYNVGIRSARSMIYKISVAVLVFAILPFGFADMSSLQSIDTNEISLVKASEITKWRAYSPSKVKTSDETYSMSNLLKNGETVIPLVSLNPSIQTYLGKEHDLLLTGEELIQREIGKLSVLSPVALFSADSLEILEPLTVSSREFKELPKSKWGLGIKVNAHGSTLLTPETSIALNSESTVQNRIGYAISCGINATVQLNYKNSLEIDMMLNDRKTQIIRGYENGSSIERRTDIVYATASLSYKRNLLNPLNQFRRKFAMNTVSGLYVSRRAGLTESLNGLAIDDLSAGYKSFDVGLNIGVDYSVIVNSKLQWTTGLKYQIGMMNVFGGVDKVPASFFKTYTNSFGLTTALMYRF